MALCEAQKSLTQKVLEYLGSFSDDLVTCWGENILNFAEENEVDAKWLYSTLNDSVRSLRDNEPSFWSVKKNYEDYMPEDFYKRGMANIAEEYLYDRYEDGHSVPGYFFNEAYKLARKFEILTNAPEDKRVSIVYAWLAQACQNLRGGEMLVRLRTKN